MILWFLFKLGLSGPLFCLLNTVFNTVDGKWMYGFKLWITGVRSNCCTNCATPLPIVLWFIILIKCKNYSKETGVCHFKTILAYSQHFFFICSICFFQPNHYAQLNLLSAACKQISKIQEFQFSDTIIFSAFFWFIIFVCDPGPKYLLPIGIRPLSLILIRIQINDTGTDPAYPNPGHCRSNHII